MEPVSMAGNHYKHERNQALYSSNHFIFANIDHPHLERAGSVEVLEGLLDAGLHGLLTLANPDAGIVLLLVRLVGALGVADLGAEVVDVVDDVVTDTGQVAPLEISVDVDLDDTVGDGLTVLLLGGAGTAVEDEENGLLVAVVELLRDVGLVLAKELGVELDVARGVDTVDIAVISLATMHGEQRMEFGLTRSQRQWRSRGRWGGKPARSARCPRAECREKRCQRRSCQHRPPRHPVCEC